MVQKEQGNNASQQTLGDKVTAAYALFAQEKRGDEVKKNDAEKQSSALVEEMFKKSVEVLRANMIPHEGVKAAATVYNQIWSRDSFITYLGTNLLNDKKFHEAAKSTLITLGKGQNPPGYIPVNYSLDEKKHRDFCHGGTDAALWYIIGLASLYSATGDRGGLFGKPLDHAIEAYRWLRAQDTNNSLLIDSQPGADWMDSAVQRQGKVMYNNVLFLMATKAINRLCKESGRSLGKDALDYNKLKKNFEKLYDPDPEEIKSGRWPYFWDHDKDFITDKPTDRLRFYPNFVTMNYVDYKHFDAFGNLLAILAGISSPEMTQNIMSYIKENRIAEPYPIKVLYPPLRKGDPYYNYEYIKGKPPYWKNSPDCYHNGGIWPFIGAFYVMALKKTGSPDYEAELEKLAKADSLITPKDRIGFNEWMNGRTGKLGGQDGQSWNAGAFIAAVLIGRDVDPFAFLSEK